MKNRNYGIRGRAHDCLNHTYQADIKEFNLKIAPPTTKKLCAVFLKAPFWGHLFIIYINDMHEEILNSVTVHFADDTELSCWDKNVKQLKKKLNDDLNQFTSAYI